MKYILMFICITISLQIQAQDYQVLPAKAGECTPLEATKKYLNDPVSSLEVQFTCVYECLDAQSQIHKVKALKTFYRSAGADEGRDMVCEGVEMEKRFVGSYEYWDIGQIRPFWAATSRLDEIQKWAEQNPVSMPSNQKQILWIEFQNKIQPVIEAYRHAGQSSPEFLKASEELLLIQVGDLKSEQVLQKYRVAYQKNPSQLWPDLNSFHLVMNVLKSQGLFLLIESSQCSSNCLSPLDNFAKIFKKV